MQSFLTVIIHKNIGGEIYGQTTMGRISISGVQTLPIRG